MEELTKENINRIINIILEEEQEKIAFKLYLVYTTKSEFLREFIKKNGKIILTKSIKYLYYLLPFVGGFNQKNELVIFERGDKLSLYILRQFDKNNISMDKITEYIDNFYLLHATYHELRHSIQKSYNDMSFEGFFCNVDYYLFSKYDYSIEHDKYFFEIDANWYGINKAMSYFKNHYPKEFPEFLRLTSEIYNEYLYDYVSFNPTERIENLIIKLKLLSFDGNYFNKIKPIISIFLDDKYNFKRLKDIMSNPNFKLLDRRISFAFLSCPSFLKNIDFNILSKDEILLLKEAITYSRSLYLIAKNVFPKDPIVNEQERKFTSRLLKKYNEFVPFSHDSIIFKNQSVKLDKYYEKIEQSISKIY